MCETWSFTLRKAIDRAGGDGAEENILTYR